MFYFLQLISKSATNKFYDFSSDKNASAISSFFEFDITLDDIERSLDRLLDYLTAPAMLVSALDFWDVAAANGPQAWELRSSLDGYQTVLASGSTHLDQFGHHVRIPIDGLRNLRPIGSDKLTFRLFGVGTTGGNWRVENVSLVGAGGSEGSERDSLPLGTRLLEVRRVQCVPTGDAPDTKASRSFGYSSNSPTLTTRRGDSIRS